MPSGHPDAPEFSLDSFRYSSNRCRIDRCFQRHVRHKTVSLYVKIKCAALPPSPLSGRQKMRSASPYVCYRCHTPASRSTSVRHTAPDKNPGRFPSARSPSKSFLLPVSFFSTRVASVTCFPRIISVIRSLFYSLPVFARNKRQINILLKRLI